jgi:hypothetical protein
MTARQLSTFFGVTSVIVALLSLELTLAANFGAPPWFVEIALRLSTFAVCVSVIGVICALKRP